MIAIALVLSTLLLAASSLVFDDPASMARSAQEAYRQDSRAATFRDVGPDRRLREIAGPRPAQAELDLGNE